MNFGDLPESKNYIDRTTAPWYDPHKIIGNIMVEVARLSGSKKQAELDAKDKIKRENPLPPATPQQQQADFNAKVERDPSGKGWTIKRQGQFNEFAPDYMNPDVIQSVLKQSGLSR
jgi:hypothetical protein